MAEAAQKTRYTAGPLTFVVRHELWDGNIQDHADQGVMIAVTADVGGKTTTLLRFNFAQHSTATGESASWAGPVDFGRDDAMMGLIYLHLPDGGVVDDAVRTEQSVGNPWAGSVQPPSGDA